MKPLDRSTLEEFVRLAADRVAGDWVLIGGTVLPLLGAGDRPTLDIDLIPVGEAPQSEILVLMEIAEELDLPVETVNQAGAYFLKRIPGFEDHLVLLIEGKSARIHRPDADLYVRSKMGRLTESDLQDCLSLLRFARAAGEGMDEVGLREIIRAEIAQAHNNQRRERLKELLRHI